MGIGNTMTMIVEIWLSGFCQEVGVGGHLSRVQNSVW